MPRFILLMSYHLFNSLLLVCISSTSFSKSPFDFFKKTNDGIILSAPLIHYKALGSSFIYPKYTPDDHIKEGELIAQGRHFSQIKPTPLKDYVAAPVYGYMLMQYNIGTPPIKSYGVFDTGSSLTWLQCAPCIHCINQTSHPIFDPRNSSSYRRLHCFDTECHKAPKWSCGSSLVNDPDMCLYYARYADATTSRGILSTETLTLSAENTSQTLPNVLFGCGNNNQDRFGNSPGIVGVGNHSVSLVHQLAVSHFSYYVFANRSHIHGEVHFGPGASLTNLGMTTPILPNESEFYHLNLTGISVDGSDLDFPPGIFENGVDKEGQLTGFVIDTGCTITWLRSEAFDVLKSAITDAMYHKGTPVSDDNFEVCYSDVSRAPEVVFRFSGLDYTLCDGHLWVRRWRLYCLAIVRRKKYDGKLSIFGFHQQKNVQVGFDLEKNLLSLVNPGVCPDDDAFVQL